MDLNAKKSSNLCFQHPRMWQNITMEVFLRREEEKVLLISICIKQEGKILHNKEIKEDTKLLPI